MAGIGAAFVDADARYIPVVPADETELRSSRAGLSVPEAATDYAAPSFSLNETPLLTRADEPVSERALDEPVLSTSEVGSTLRSPPGDGWLVRPFRVTHYCLEGRMSNRRPVHYGAVAADPTVFPLGTTIEIEGLGIYVVEDRFGWDAQQPRLDVWTRDCDEAWHKGVRHMRVRSLGTCPLLAREMKVSTSLKAMDELLTFIAIQRPDVAEFFEAGGWSQQSMMAIIEGWLEVDEEGLLDRASRNPLVIACALSAAAREGLGP